MAITAEQISLAKLAAARLATKINQYKWFNGVDFSSTQDGKDIVLLVYLKEELPLHHKYVIPKTYENFDIITMKG